MGKLSELRHDTEYQILIDSISSVVNQNKEKAIKALNLQLLTLNWEVGKYIVEFEQNGEVRSKYGDNLLSGLSKDLTTKLGKGFSRSNIANMRLFYLRFPKIKAVPEQLTWSHIIEILSIDDELERNFYIVETKKNNWSYRELHRQKNSALFARIALSKDKRGILELSEKGNEVSTPEDIVRNHYVLEFLNLPIMDKVRESTLEKALLNHLQEFLLELGKGFAFIGSQYRLTIDNINFYADLVFYHVILKRYVIIDLKVGEVRHEDIGQMNLYLGYFALDVNNEDDNEPIGIILGANKNDTVVKYATHGMDVNLFVSEYQLYLPDVDELRQLVQDELDKEGY
ncbi:PDDEXK nuclease domain-containing protein [Pseudolactococcus yaeyamensis]